MHPLTHRYKSWLPSTAGIPMTFCGIFWSDSRFFVDNNTLSEDMEKVTCEECKNLYNLSLLEEIE
jgi:hypothetical protein